VWGDLRPSSSRSRQGRYFTLGFAAQDATAARGLVGQEARPSSNIQIPGRALARLRILEVDASMALLLAEVLPETVEEAISPSDAVASPPGTA
jgi:hypothetical protein